MSTIRQNRLFPFSAAWRSRENRVNEIYLYRMNTRSCGRYIFRSRENSRTLASTTTVSRNRRPLVATNFLIWKNIWDRAALVSPVLIAINVVPVIGRVRLNSRKTWEGKIWNANSFSLFALCVFLFPLCVSLFPRGFRRAIVKFKNAECLRSISREFTALVLARGNSDARDSAWVMLFRVAHRMEFDEFIFPSRIFPEESRGGNQFFYFRDSGHGVNSFSVYRFEKPCILADKRRILNVNTCVSDVKALKSTAWIFVHSKSTEDNTYDPKMNSIFPKVADECGITFVHSVIRTRLSAPRARVFLIRKLTIKVHDDSEIRWWQGA